MGLGPMQSTFLALLIWPFLHVIFSSRSHGGSKLGWLIVVTLFSLLGYAVFLIVTQKTASQNAS